MLYYSMFMTIFIAYIKYIYFFNIIYWKRKFERKNEINEKKNKRII